MDGFCLTHSTESSTVSLLFLPAIFFSAESKWKGISREPGPAHFQAKFSFEEKHFAPRSEEINPRAGRVNFALVELRIDFKAGSEQKYSHANSQPWNCSLGPQPVPSYLLPSVSFIILCLSVSVCQSVCLSVYLSVSVSLSLSFCLCLSVSLSH